MPKAVSVSAPVPKDQFKEATANIISARVVRDQWTSIGTLKYGLGLEVTINDNEDDEYSALFSLDKDTLTGSVGRLLVAAGITEFELKDIDDAFFSPLVGMKATIKVRDGKLYWYPVEAESDE